MDFDLNDEQRELRDTARRFLEREAPVSYARAMMDDERGHRPDVWKRMADLGWMALALPEDHDGLGLGFIAQSILLIEMGRVVLPGPYTPTILAALAITGSESDAQQKSLLPAFAAGDLIGAVAADDDVQERNGAIFGTARCVASGRTADRVVVLARTDGGQGLFVAEPSRTVELEWMDRTRRAADVIFDGAAAEPVTTDPTAVQGLLDRAALAYAAEMLGCAERVLELSVEYAKERVQFGRPIGSFQAVKHRLADMLVDVESIRNAVYYASWAVEREHPDASLAASMAKACASDAAVRVAKSGVQVHGGIGFTWEHDMHLYLKRVKACEVSFGDATWHRERIAQLLRARMASPDA